MSLIPFPNVPNVPGVPSLLRHATVPTPDSLVNQGVTALVEAVFGEEEWGVYNKKDKKWAIKHDVFVSVSHKRAYTVSSYIMENGAFASYNKAGAPFTCTVKLAVGEDKASRNRFLDRLDEMLTSTDVYTIKTPEHEYDNVTLQNYSYDRTGQDGARLITAELIFVEVREREQESEQKPPVNPESQDMSFSGRISQQFTDAKDWFVGVGKNVGNKLGALVGKQAPDTINKIGESPRWMVL